MSETLRTGHPLVNGASHSTLPEVATTLAHIADSFGLKPAKLAAMVGMGEVGVDTPLTPQQIAFALDAADNNPFVGPTRPARHRLTP